MKILKSLALSVIFSFMSMSGYSQVYDGRDYTGWTVYDGTNFTSYYRQDGTDSVLFYNCTWDQQYFGTGSLVYLNNVQKYHFVNCTVTDNRHTNNADFHWINATDKIDSLLVKGCVVRNQSADAIQIGLSHDTVADPTDFMGHIRIEDNHFYVENGVSSENALDIKGSGNTEIINNNFHGYRGCSPNQGCTGDDGIGIILHRWSTKNVLIEGNKIWNSNEGIRAGSGEGNRQGPPKGIIIRNNFIYDNSTHIVFLSYVEDPHIYSNTFGDYSGTSVRTTGSREDTLFASNILGYTGSYDADDINSGAFYNMKGTNNVWKELNSSDFVDATNSDSSLKNFRITSSATDVIDQRTTNINWSNYYTGTLYDIDSTQRPIGSGVDIGAHELSSGCPSIVPTVSIINDTNNQGVGKITITSTSNLDYPATYLWSNSDADSIAQSLTAGTYSVTITGDSGCVGSGQWDIISINDAECQYYTLSDSGLFDFGEETYLTTGYTQVYDTVKTYYYGDIGVTPSADYNYSSNGRTDVTGFENNTSRDMIFLNSGATVEYTISGLDNTARYSFVGSFNYNVNGTAEVFVDINGTRTDTINIYSNDVTEYDTITPVSGEITFLFTENSASNRIAINGLKVYKYVSDPMSISGVVTDETESQGNGSIDVTVSGGTTPYTYLWDDGPTTQDRTSLGASTYGVTVTDNGGCEKTDSYVVSNIGSIDFILSSTDITCNTYDDGTANVGTISGGTSPYSIAWDDGPTTSGRSNLSSGWYYVEVTDAFSLFKRDSIFINEPEAVRFDNIIINNVTCYGDSTGSVLLTAGGGISPYVYDWTEGEDTDFRNDLPAGSYSVTVYDDNNCSASTNFDITNINTEIQLSSAIVDEYNGDNAGSINLSVSGGDPTYTYSWQPGGETTQDLSSLSGGTYTVTVTDDSSCEKVGIYRVENIVPPTEGGIIINVENDKGIIIINN